MVIAENTRAKKHRRSPVPEEAVQKIVEPSTLLWPSWHTHTNNCHIRGCATPTSHSVSHLTICGTVSFVCAKTVWRFIVLGGLETYRSYKANPWTPLTFRTTWQKTETYNFQFSSAFVCVCVCARLIASQPKPYSRQRSCCPFAQLFFRRRIHSAHHFWHFMTIAYNGHSERKCPISMICLNNIFTSSTICVKANE